LRSVLDRLGQDSRRIERAWLALLHRLEPTRDEYDALAAMDLAGCYLNLKAVGRPNVASGDEAYRLGVERAVRNLLRSGVADDVAVAAVALYLEACLGCMDRAATARPLVRLTSVTQRLVLSGYAEERTASLRRIDDRERQKVSGALHDEVGADLVVLKLYVEMITVELAKGSVAPVGAKLREALALIAHAIESVRRLTLDLGPAFLDSLGFLPALRSFLRQFALGTGIRIELQGAELPVALPASHETALYRVLRGALSNVAKHSKARHVSVTLRRVRGVFVMIVEDDGKGFDLRALGSGRSFGFTAMRERIRGLHGHLSIESWTAPRRGRKAGTRIEVRLPLRKRVAA
jgi:signal transduction histidine kinase